MVEALPHESKIAEIYISLEPVQDLVRIVKLRCLLTPLQEPLVREMLVDFELSYYSKLLIKNQL